MTAIYMEHRFKKSMDESLEKLRFVLQSSRRPTYPGEVDHSYSDKYSLAELLVNTSIAAQFATLQHLGLDEPKLRTLLEFHAKGKALQLRLVATEKCTFLREAKRTVTSPSVAVTETVTKSGGLLGKSEKTTSVERTVKSTVVEYFFKFTVSWQLVVVPGNDEAAQVVLAERTGSCVLCTGVNKPPKAGETPVTKKVATCEVTWLVGQLAPQQLRCRFAVDREAAATPTRNEQVKEALEAARRLFTWAQQADAYLTGQLCSVERELRPPDKRGDGKKHGWSCIHVKRDTTEEDEGRPALPPGVHLLLQGLEPGASANASLAKSALFLPVLPLFEGASSGSVEAVHDAKCGDAKGGGTVDASPHVALDVCGDGPGAAAPARAADAPPTPSSSSAPPPEPQPLTPMVDIDAGAAPPPGSPLLSLEDVERLLAEQRAALARHQRALRGVFPSADDDGALFSSREAEVVAGCVLLKGIAQQLADGVQHIEEMLRKQLVAALGKTVTPSDLWRYLDFHSQRLYRAAVAPQPFTFAVRRHAAANTEGEVALEARLRDATKAEPLATLVRKARAPAAPMSFRLSAASRVTFYGERYLHALVVHEFGRQSCFDGPLCLTARARQFSCFMVLLGRMGPEQTFQPKHAITLQNKDDLSIPLQLEALPTPKEFTDAIASLSPEQRRFAQAYRAMQLEGSVFGVLVLQLKPQLERVLNLPADALTKEIALTQTLMRLFVEFQIPSGLLSYDGDDDAPAAAKLEQVKAHAQALMDMIDAEKRGEVKDAYLASACAGGGVAPRPARLPSGESESDYDEDDDGGGCSRNLCESGCMGMETLSCAPTRRGGGGGGAACMKKKCCAPSMCRSRMCAAAPQMQMQMMAAPPPPPAAACGAMPCPPPMPGGGPPPPPMPKPAAPAKASTAATPAEPPPVRPERSAVAPQPELDTTEGAEAEAEAEAEAIDYTLVASRLDAKLAEQDTDAALRPTTISVGASWTLTAKAALLSPPTTKVLAASAQEEAQQQAFDLLDALTRSGALPIEHCALHVIVAATHCFAKSLMDTVIVDNVNPVEKFERSSLIVNSTVQDLPPTELLRDDAQRLRVATYSAPLLVAPPEPSGGLEITDEGGAADGDAAVHTAAETPAPAKQGSKRGFFS